MTLWCGRLQFLLKTVTKDTFSDRYKMNQECLRNGVGGQCDLWQDKNVVQICLPLTFPIQSAYNFSLQPCFLLLLQFMFSITAVFHKEYIYVFGTLWLTPVFVQLMLSYQTWLRDFNGNCFSVHIPCIIFSIPCSLRILKMWQWFFENMLRLKV